MICQDQKRKWISIAMAIAICSIHGNDLLCAQSGVKLSNPVLTKPGNTPNNNAPNFSKPNDYQDTSNFGPPVNSGATGNADGSTKRVFSLQSPKFEPALNTKNKPSAIGINDSSAKTDSAEATPFVPKPAFGSAPSEENSIALPRGLQPSANQLQTKQPTQPARNGQYFHRGQNTGRGSAIQQYPPNQYPPNQYPPNQYPANQFSNGQRGPIFQNQRPMVQPNSGGSVFGPNVFGTRYPQSLQRPAAPNQQPTMGNRFAFPRPALPPNGNANPNSGIRTKASPNSIPQHLPNTPKEALPEGVEIIRERYKSGAVRIERQVILDQNQNYINHGSWKYFLPTGRLAALAYFENGKKTGSWSRWLTTADAPLLGRNPYRQFKGPFLSTFQYKDDVLNGTWKLADSTNRTIFEINLAEGKRDSVCTWLFANGKKFQEIHYQEGSIHGTYRKWNIQGQLVEDRKFEDGREIGHVTEFHRQGVKKLEYGILAGRVDVMTLDNPWRLEFAVEKKVGEDIRNGPVTAWYSNGQVQFTGAYSNDSQNGTFTWFYETGQKQAEGIFEGDQRTGKWVWWHNNGMRASTGNYAKGLPRGDWQWWLADGKLSRTKSFDGLDSVESDQMKNASFRKNK